MALTEEQINQIQDPETREQVRQLQQQQQSTGPYASGAKGAPTGTAADVGDKPDETRAQRRGTTSPTGTYRVGNTEVPLSDPAVATVEDVRARMKEKADAILAEIEGSDDPEAVVFRDKINSGNYEELDLAQMSAALNDPASKQSREQYAQKKEQREAAKAERQKQLEEKKAEQAEQEPTT